MPITPVSGDITSQEINDNLSYLDGEKIGKSGLLYVNVQDYGAVGDGIADDTPAIQAAIDFLKNQSVGTHKGGVVQLEQKEYLADSLTFYSHISIQGQGKGRSVLRKKTGGTDTDLITGTDVNNVSIKGVSIYQASDDGNLSDLISFTSSTGVTISNIVVDDCELIDTANGRQNLILLQGIVDEVYITNNIFKGYVNTTSTYDASLLLIDNAGQSNNGTKAWILNNVFDGGKRGCTVEGTGNPPDLFISNNIIKNQTIRGLNIYHGMRWTVSHNTFRDINARSSYNNDGAAIWLDISTPDVSHKGCEFIGNTITDITGNAVLLEEFTGVVANNEITNVLERVGDTFSTDYTYESVTTTHTSNGGHGIHITGGCRDFIIEGNKMYNITKAGINIDRSLGIQKTYEIENGTIQGNKIQSNDNGIEIMERVVEVNIIGNEIRATNNPIFIDRTHTSTNNVFGKGFISGNVLKGTSGIYKTYDYGYGYIVGNTVERTGVALQWTNNQGATTGNLNINLTDKTTVVF